MHRSRLTFILPELVESLEAHCIVDVVGLESDAEELAIRVDFLLISRMLRTTKALHFTILKVDVEIGKLYVIALCIF